VLRQPDRVVRQPEESSSIEASTYRKPSSYNTHTIHLDQHSQEGGNDVVRNRKEEAHWFAASKALEQSNSSGQKWRYRRYFGTLWLESEVQASQSTWTRGSESQPMTFVGMVGYL
jgi:hypothetical protein